MTPISVCNLEKLAPNTNPADAKITGMQTSETKGHVWKSLKHAFKETYIGPQFLGVVIATGLVAVPVLFFNYGIHELRAQIGKRFCYESFRGDCHERISWGYRGHLYTAFDFYCEAIGKGTASIAVGLVGASLLGVYTDDFIKGYQKSYAGSGGDGSKSVKKQPASESTLES